jgi:hypothetical protein
MRINAKMNTYPTGPSHPVGRPTDAFVTASDGPLGGFQLTVKDFSTLTMIRDKRGWLNDNIVNAVLQTLIAAVRRDKPESDRSPASNIFLSTYFRQTWQNGLGRTPADLHSIGMQFKKQGVTPDNLESIHDIYLPINLNREHWVLAVWHPRRHAMTWFDSLAPAAGPREEYYTTRELVYNVWKAWAVGSVPTWEKWDSNCRVARCPQQQNELDCGIYLLTACLFRVLGYGGFLTGAGKDNLLRNYFAAVLLQGGWRGELPWGWPSPTVLPAICYEQVIDPASQEYAQLGHGGARAPKQQDGGSQMKKARGAPADRGSMTAGAKAIPADGGRMTRGAKRAPDDGGRMTRSAKRTSDDRGSMGMGAKPAPEDGGNMTLGKRPRDRT